MSSFYRHSLEQFRDRDRARHASTNRDRERQAFMAEHFARAAKVAKLVATFDAEAIERGLNPYRGAQAVAALLETLTDEQWERFARRAAVRPASQQTREAVVEAYRERARGPHCAGLETMSLARLQTLGGELQTLLDRATDAERREAWYGYALITEREVHSEISIRARKAAS
jgi:hypothetical protein